MNILVFADLHHWSKEELLSCLSYNNYTCCILLGDIDDETLIFIKANIKSDVKLFGVVGNHDEWNTLIRNNIEDISGKTICVNGIVFAGLSGSHRYNDEQERAMLTQKESIIAAKELQKADVFISHDTAYRAMHFSDNVHCGLKGISKYLKKYAPMLNLFGHYHSCSLLSYHKTTLLCIYRCALITIDINGRMKKWRELLS